MSGEKECPACVRRVASVVNNFCGYDCTGRPGCVRAAGTEGGATDGMGTRVVDWPGESEITRLRAENARLTKERYDPVMVALRRVRSGEIARRVRSGEIAGYMGPEVVILSRAQHDSDYEAVTRLRAEVERLTAENERLAVAVVLNEADTLADRHARDLAVVKAALAAAATTATRLPYPGLDPWHGHTVDNFAIMVGKAIRAIDPEAVLKAMEEGRDG